MLKLISLTRGVFAKVDDEDFEVLSSVKWHAVGRRIGAFYARHDRRIGRFLVVTAMHRFLMGNPRGLQVDHKDGDPLNNQKGNLRVATHSENMRNRGVSPKRSASGYKGVTYRGDCWGKWRVRINTDGKNRIHIGDFSTPEEAALAYNAAAIKYHGEFARLNEVTM